MPLLPAAALAIEVRAAEYEPWQTLKIWPQTSQKKRIRNDVLLQYRRQES
jgi:hypothetical protein